MNTLLTPADMESLMQRALDMLCVKLNEYEGRLGYADPGSRYEAESRGLIATTMHLLKQAKLAKAQARIEAIREGRAAADAGRRAA